MRTFLPTQISNEEQAKAYLQALYKNGESYHPDDSVESIDGLDATPQEASHMNELMRQVRKFIPDPSEYLLDLDGHIMEGDEGLEYMIKSRRLSIVVMKNENEVGLYVFPNGRWIVGEFDYTNEKCKEVYTLVVDGEVITRTDIHTAETDLWAAMGPDERGAMRMLSGKKSDNAVETAVERVKRILMPLQGQFKGIEADNFPKEVSEYAVDADSWATGLTDEQIIEDFKDWL